MGGVRVSEGGRHVGEYALSFVSLCKRLQERLRILFEMRGATWNDAFIDAYWPATVYIGGRTYSKMQRILKLTESSADNLQYREMASLVDAIASSLLAPPERDKILYDEVQTYGWGAWKSPARNFVHPITRMSLGPGAEDKLATFEEFARREMPLSANYRAHDARILNWLHDVLDHLWLIKVPKGAIVCDVPGSLNPSLAYQPTHTYRRYEPTGAHVAGFVWPSYHPLPEGGVLTTDTQPRAVWVEQKFSQRWTYIEYYPGPPPWSGWVLYGYDPWVGFPDSQITSMNPAHGWYYANMAQLYDQPLNRAYAGWVSYARTWRPPAVDPTGRHYYHAEAYRSRYASTLTEMQRWDEIAAYANRWEWLIECRHDIRAYDEITFVAETPVDHYEWTLQPGEKTSEIVTFTMREGGLDPVDLYVQTPIPSTTPHDLWYPLGTPYTGDEGIAASVMRVTQEPLPDLFVDIRDELGETPVSPG